MGIVLFGPIKRIFEYLFTYYTIDSEKLSVKSGWLTKNSIEIPLSTITTVDFTQNLIHQIFHVYKLKIDNASNINTMNDHSKIKMTFNKKDAYLVKEILSKKISDKINGFNIIDEPSLLEIKEEPEDNVYTVLGKDIVLMGLLKSKLLLALGVIPIATAAISTIIQWLSISDKTVFDFFESIVNQTSSAIAIIVLVLLIYIMLLIIGIIISVIRYYNFKIINKNDSIHIEYGLFTKKKFTLMKEKISGFAYEQTILMRLLKWGTLQVYAIGYGKGDADDNNEEAIVCPILKLANLNNFMSGIIPELSINDIYERPGIKSFRYFFVSVGFIFSVAIFISSIIISFIFSSFHMLWVAGMVVSLIGLFSVYLEYKNTGIYGNSNNVSISNGAFKKTTVYIKTSNIESISEKASVFKRKKRITTVKLFYLAPLLVATSRAKNISIEMFNKIKEELIY